MLKANEGQRGTCGEFRRGLMLYGSTAAIAAALMLAEGGVGPAMAQEIGPRVSPSYAAQGDFTVPGPTPSPSFEYRSNTLDIVHMNRDAVLNWTTYDQAPNGGANGGSYVNFLPKDTELRFVGNGQSFTAINRIFTNPDNAGVYRGVAFQGRVTSYLFGDGPNSVGPVGGNIWFFSPGGILASASASFNVGSLLLSASDISDFVEGGSYRYANFTGVADPFASVIIQPGASIALTQPGSSFAVVAPTIEQGGTVSVDGSVLYMSAEQGAISAYDSGQVYGSIYVEAQPGNRIRHTGTTTGPASLTTDDFSVYDYQTIEFRTGGDVGVLLSGSIGYAPATDAALGENGTIILSAGGAVASEGNLTLSSTLSVEAPSLILRAGAGETISAGSDANGGYGIVAEVEQATITAAAGGRIDIDGSLTVTGQYAEGHDYAVNAEAASGNLAGGQIDIGGSLFLDASAGRYSYGGQQGGRAAVNLGDGAHLGVVGEMTVLADGYAGYDDSEITAARGGEATVTMTGNASLNVGSSLVVSAQALPFFGNCECFPPPSGSAQGGTAKVTATGGTIAAAALVVAADAEAHSGFSVEPGASTDATGGTAVVDLGDSNADISSISVSATARGSEGVFGNDGGAAFGGTASFSKGSGGSLALDDIGVTANARGGDGSDPYQGTTAGSGGDAEGGSASIALGQTAEGLDYLELSAEARGGDASSAEAYDELDGGSGGNARGGTASLTLTGGDTVLAGLSEGDVSIAAYGGDGGDGAEDYNNSVQSGNGGVGGSAMAGGLAIEAAGGATYVSELTPQVAAVGGSGGNGGNAVSGEGGVGAPGLGGAGGDALGGQVSLIADGGTISGDLYLDVSGEGGEGGVNGYDANENYTGGADYGAFTGGSITLATLDNGPSRFDLGDVSLISGGDQSGTISISHAATSPDAQMSFGTLYATVTGTPGSPVPAFHLSAVNGVTAQSGVQVYAGSMAFDFSGTGALAVYGSTSLSSFDGSIAITHVNNPGVISIDSAGFFSAYATGDYFAGPGTVVRGGSDDFNIYATGSITAADSRGSGSIIMSAQGDATIGNVLVNSGYYGQGDFTLYAGRVEFDGPHGYYPDGNALVTGTVDVAGSVLVEAGGSAQFASGSQVFADQSITVRTGDDILIASGATLASDINSDFDDETMHLLAGDINLGGQSGDLIDPINSPIASLVIAGSLETNGHALYLSGDAIDGTGGSISTGDLSADVTDAPDLELFSSDAGLLTPGCFQGSMCLGDVTATGNVAIGLDSNNGLVSLKLRTMNFTGSTFDVLTREGLEIGIDGFGSLVSADTRVSLESANSFVSLANVTVEAPDLAIRAGGDLAADTSNLRSPSNILLQIGGDITVGTIDTGGRLDDGSGAPTFAAPGSFVVRSLRYGGGNDILVDAPGEISIAFADSQGADIELFADGDVYLGSTAPATGSIRLDGAAVSFTNLIAGGLVYATAGDGGITGVSEGSPTIQTAGSIALETSGAVVVQDLRASDDIAVSGSSVSAGSLSAGDALAVAAEGVSEIGSFRSGGDAVFSGASVDIGGGYAGGLLAAEANEGDLAFGTLGAGGAGVLAASGAISGGDVIVGGALTLLAGSLDIGGAEADGGITASIGGGATFTTLSSDAGPITVSADGDISGTRIDAAGDVGLSGASVSVSNVSAGANLAVAGANLAATTLNAGGAIDIGVGAGATIGAAVAGTSFSFDGGELTAGSLNAGDELDVGVANSAAIDSLSSGGSATVFAGNVQLGDATTAGDLSLVSNGNIDADVLTAGGGLWVLAGSTLGAGEGSVVFDGGDITFTSASAGSSAQFVAGGAVTGGTLAAEGFASVEAAGAIALGGLDARNAQLRSTGGAVSASGVVVEDVLWAYGTALTLDAPGALTVNAIASAGAIGITAGGDLTVDATATGDIALASTGGSVFIGSVGELDAAPGGVGVQSVDADGAVSVTAAQGISVADSLTAGGALTMTAGGLISLDGVARGQTIALQARDLAIGSSGALGDGGTQRISLSSASPVNLGAGASGGFAVDQAEFSRIHSGGDLLLTALAGEGGGLLTVNNLTISAGEGGQIGSTGTFGLTSTGAVKVSNTLGVTSAGSGTMLSLSGDTVDLDYATAVLSVGDGASAPTGRIGITGRLITSMSAAAAADIMGKTPEQINVRLGQADVVRDTGLFRTSNLTLQGVDAILIQNSGGNPADDRRGLTVGALTVTGANDGHTLVVINGVVNNATGVDAAQNVSFTTPIASGSTFNGCVLANIAGCLPVIEPEPPAIVSPGSILFGTSDFIKSDESEDTEVEDGVADGKPEAPPIDTAQIDDPAGRPMIDDPVTGAGNEDLWQTPE